MSTKHTPGPWRWAMSYDLRDAKVGDAVAVRRLFSGDIEKRTVVKATATQVTLDDGSRWLRIGRKV